MAKVKNNLILEGLSGKIGNQLVLKQVRGRTIVCKKPVFSADRKFSDKQLARQRFFSEATRFASKMKEQPPYPEIARETDRIGYNVALADWLNPPQILQVDLQGWNGAAQDLIRMRVQDDVRVAQVLVEIHDETGTLLESGQAVEAGASWWEYRLRQPLSGALGVTICASDLPGHVTRVSQEKLVMGVP